MGRNGLRNSTPPATHSIVCRCSPGAVGQPPRTARCMDFSSSLAVSERVAKRLHHERGPLILESHLRGAMKKHSLAISRIRINRGSGNEARRGIDRDGILICVNNSRPKLYRRNVALARRLKAQDKRNCSVGRRFWLGAVRDNRWLEECGSFTVTIAGEEGRQGRIYASPRAGDC